MIEIWKDIVGYEGYYQVSNLGGFRSVDRYIVDKNGNKKFVKSKTYDLTKKSYRDKDGYVEVALCKLGKTKYYRVHRLVWEAFNGKIQDGMVINHKNEIKNDNRLSNIEVCTVLYNNCYGNRQYVVHKKFMKPVLQFTLDGTFIKEFESQSSAALELGVEQAPISMCCRGLRPTAYGYIWKFKNG